MAVKTLGTNANNSIANAIPWAPGIGSGVANADFATITQAIKTDGVPFSTQDVGLRLAPEGILYLPKARGFIKLLPGDWIGVDTRGWPIVLSADTIANGLWTHS